MTFKKKTKSTPDVPVKSSERPSTAGAFSFSEYGAPAPCISHTLYKSLREAVPILDAAIGKLVRLTVGFDVHCKNSSADKALSDFLGRVPVSGNGCGMHSFLCTYLDQLLVFGTSIGEMIVQEGNIHGLYNARLSDVELRRSADGFHTDVLAGYPLRKPVPYPNLILLSTLRPEPGALYGTSLLEGLPFVSSILLKIFAATGQNWDRVGNVRFAVTYKPQNDTTDRAFAKERAMQVAKQWSEAMQPSGRIRDFVTVGDVQIKAIGADSPIPDSEVPVRQMLEQILAKTGLPPFLLGLSWSSTERMSTQQADILTSELEYYRSLLSPVLLHICRTFLRLQGFSDEPIVTWKDITLQDEVELARAKLYNAQAEQILQNLSRKEETH